MLYHLCLSVHRASVSASLVHFLTNFLQTCIRVDIGKECLGNFDK